MEIGDFIFINNKYGIGKVILIDQDEVEIEFFINIVEQIVNRYNKDELEIIYLGIQARVYIEEEDGSWKIGRVIDLDDTINFQMDYEIQFPNQKKAWYGTDELKTRSLTSLLDPTELLAVSGGETQFLYESRKNVQKWMIQLRGASRGLSALSSASIELVSHQINIVKKILTDPIQRYLLSDEVGMGKTIEAGVIVRQTLLDSSLSKVLIIVPDHLVGKWYHEMEGRFYINDFQDRVSIITPKEMKNIDETPDLIIIDEAHHIVGESEKYDKQTSNKIISMAKESEKLLLLSATPTVGDEDILLELLKILDPLVFENEPLEYFKEKISQQAKYGSFLRVLKIGQSPFLLKRTLSKIETIFPNDDVAKELTDKILMKLEKKEKLDKYIQELKTHLVETWQLHNRLIRTRRIDLDEIDGLMFQDRGDFKNNTYLKNHIELMYHPNAIYTDINTTIEEWRNYLFSKVETFSPIEKLPFIQRYIKLLEYSNYTFENLKELIDSFINDPIDEGEINRLEAIENTLIEYNYADSIDKVSLNIKSFLNKLDLSSIGVIFVSDSGVAQQYQNSLREIFKEEEILIFNNNEPNDEIRIYICDKDAEEGSDFQFADAIIHLDLPLDPSRIEQRIGRLDRFGRAKSQKIQHLILLPLGDELYPWKRWFELLFEGFGVFNRPISDIQLKLKSINEKLHYNLFVYGVDGLSYSFDENGNIEKPLIEYIHNVINEEREALDEQYALNYLSIQEDDSLNLREEIEESEYPEKELEQNVNHWLFDVLRLYKWYDNNKSFQINWDNKKTLLPKKLFVDKGGMLSSERWERKFKNILERPLTYRRDEAITNHQTSLIRIGHPLFATLEEYLNWEDRGRAFSTFRIVDDTFPIFIPHGEIKIIFKLNFIVEASKMENISNQALYQRRTDEYFRPEVLTLYIDEEMQIVHDNKIIDILEQPYDKNRDTNLSSRRYVIENFIEKKSLIQLCRDISENAKEILLTSQTFIEKHENSLSQIEKDTYKRISTIKRRMAIQQSYNSPIDKTVYQKTIKFEKSLKDGILNPTIKLDSFGMFFISRFSISDLGLLDE